MGKVWKRDERGYIIGQGKERFGVVPIAVTEDDTNDLGRPISRRIPYLEGVRGLLGIQTLLWIFFRLFAPAIVTDTDLDGTMPAKFLANSPEWMTVLRKVLSPLLFDGSLQMTMFIVLMGRASMQTFIERRSGVSLAGVCIRRPLRLFFPVTIALAIASALAATNAFRYSNWLAAYLNNDMLRAPAVWTSTVYYVNSVVTLYFAPQTFMDSVAVQALPPYGVGWFISVIFQQTYVMTVVAWTIPFAILRYKVACGIGYILLCAWVGRWSWLTLTGLGICEFSVVHLQALPADKAFYFGKDKKFRISYKVIPLVFLVLGTFFKYLWIAGFPSAINNEINFHANLNTGKLNYNNEAAIRAWPRYDNWLFATGFFLLLELSPRMQSIFSIKPLVFLARFSFSIIMISTTVMMALGGLLYQHLVLNVGMTNIASLTGIMFLAMVPVGLVSAFIYTMLVDDPSSLFARYTFKFLIAP